VDYELTLPESRMPQSNEQTALITGAARGIGLATARRFLAEGWSVALLDIDGDTLRRAMAEINEPERTLALTCDVALPDQVSAAIAETKTRFGALHALVNNAGTAVFKPALETSFEEFQRTMAVNVAGAFLMTKACVPLMGRGASIVNITSISGLRASALRIAYGTSKAALAHLTKQLALELSVRGIRVNAVAPGPVDTAMAKAVHSPAIRADYHASIPLGRYGLEEELAEAIFFLCSERASYITGQEIAVDGGFDAIGIGLPTFRNEQGGDAP
jgi:NAD(P)-dependent dehydrogenase (short-subunit alcohol dehydrogenase family)